MTLLKRASSIWRTISKRILRYAYLRLFMPVVSKTNASTSTAAGRSRNKIVIALNSRSLAVWMPGQVLENANNQIPCVRLS
jgi:hypothetical protein